MCIHAKQPTEQHSFLAARAYIPELSFTKPMPFAWGAAELEDHVNDVWLHHQLLLQALYKVRVAIAENGNWQGAEP